MPKTSSNQRKVIERGGSVVVTIPAVLAAQLGIKGGSVVSFETNGRALTVRLVNGSDGLMKDRIDDLMRNAYGDDPE